MELPNYRFPSLKSVLLLMWEKARDFLERAFTIIFLASMIIWFLQTFDSRLNVVTDSANSLLAILGHLLAPIFKPLGFADWRISTALVTGITAKEAVVSTLSVLLGTNAAHVSAALGTLFTVRSAVSFLVFTLLYTPCVAAIAAIKQEMHSTLKTIGIVIMQCGVAWITAWLVYIGSGVIL
jgi:ferrous iron transport protein B